MYVYRLKLALKKCILIFRDSSLDEFRTSGLSELYLSTFKRNSVYI